MKARLSLLPCIALLLFTFKSLPSSGQIGTRFPSERKVISDPMTGARLVFLTTKPAGDSKIYQTHSQWTADGKWLVFRSNRVRGEAMAVNEETGDIVQITEGGYTGMLCVARKSMKLYMMRFKAPSTERMRRDMEVVVVDLEKLFADSEKGKLKSQDNYQKVVGQIAASLGAGGDMALDANEDFVYFRVGKEEAAKHLSPETKIEPNFGPRNMGAGPAGLMSLNITTGELRYIVSVPFQIGHVQSNPFVPGEIVFCWETGGKAPQRTWIVNSDGTGLRPLYPEAEYEWVTHEAVITKDEVAIAIMGHRKPGIPDMTPDPSNPGQEKGWGPCGTREKPTGLGIVNLRTREMRIAGQTPSGSGLWHVTGSEDCRWAAGDNFERGIYLIDRHSGEMILLSGGHKTTAADHPHPTFSPDGTRIEIQSAMLSEDNKSMNICIIHLPQGWLNRKY
ncbi:MAG: hypothetical protein U0X39_03340 [Bacteroidales bacterium]